MVFMGLVALTVGCLALGAYMGRDLTGGAAIALSVGAVTCVIGLNSASAGGRELIINARPNADPAALWQAAGSA
jgi:hypothetical protein